MSIFQRAKSRLNEIREEDRKKSQERKIKKEALESKRRVAYDEAYEKGTVERARREGRQKAMQKTGLGLSVKGLVGGLETGGRMIGTFGQNLSIGLMGESPRRSPRRKHKKTKKRSVRKKQSNDWLW